MPYTFGNETLEASELNTYMLQPGTSGTGTRLVSGTHAVVFSSVSEVDTTISYGFTFSSAPKVMGTVQVGSNFRLVVGWNNTPGTTSVSAKVFQVAGTSISGTATVYWVAIGPA